MSDYTDGVKVSISARDFHGILDENDRLNEIVRRNENKTVRNKDRFDSWVEARKAWDSETDEDMNGSHSANFLVWLFKKVSHRTS